MPNNNESGGDRGSVRRFRGTNGERMVEHVETGNFTEGLPESHSWSQYASLQVPAQPTSRVNTITPLALSGHPLNLSSTQAQAQSTNYRSLDVGRHPQSAMSNPAFNANLHMSRLASSSSNNAGTRGFGTAELSDPLGQRSAEHAMPIAGGGYALSNSIAGQLRSSRPNNGGASGRGSVSSPESLNRGPATQNLAAAGGASPTSYRIASVPSQSSATPRTYSQQPYQPTPSAHNLSYPVSTQNYQSTFSTNGYPVNLPGQFNSSAVHRNMHGCTPEPVTSSNPQPENSTAKCPHCPSEFKGPWCNGSLHRHLKQKHSDEKGEEIYFCEVCEPKRKYKRKDAMLKHLRTHPELEIPPPVPRPRHNGSQQNSSSPSSQGDTAPFDGSMSWPV